MHFGLTRTDSVIQFCYESAVTGCVLQHLLSAGCIGKSYILHDAAVMILVYADEECESSITPAERSSEISYSPRNAENANL